MTTTRGGGRRHGRLAAWWLLACHLLLAAALVGGSAVAAGAPREDDALQTSAAAGGLRGGGAQQTINPRRSANSKHTIAINGGSISIPTDEEPTPRQGSIFDFEPRSLRAEDDDAAAILLAQPPSYQIAMSIVLSSIIAAQLVLLGMFVRHRHKRVLEFAQPLYVCALIAAGTVATATCYLFLYLTNAGCAMREPLLFLALSLMGATIAGRAWRISSLMDNPLMTGDPGDRTARVERARRFVMRALSALSGCQCSRTSLRNGLRGSRASGGGGGRPLRVQIAWGQMLRAISILCVPQAMLQTIVLATPALRSGKVVAAAEYYGATITVGQYQCASTAAGAWPLYVGVLFVLLPHACAYLLNLRPKADLEKLPGIIDERPQLEEAFAISARILLVAGPVVGFTYYYHAPAIRSYAAICAVLGLTLSLSYNIAFVKLASLRSNRTKRRRGSFASSRSLTSNNDQHAQGRGSAAFAVKMAEMYSKIGRTEETLTLIDETLEIWKGGGNGGGVFGNQDAREEVACGFTKTDLRTLEPGELEMILRLLIIKGDALMRLHGLDGFPMSAEMNISAMKIFEHCPASQKIKDTSIMFPIYNRVGVQVKGGVIDQDDACSLEMDLAKRFAHEALVQAYHLARALGNLAEWYGRVGAIDKAFEYFSVMKAIYLPKDHPSLLYAAYAVNRCAITFAVSSLWYLQKGDVKGALERVDQVERDILPSYDRENDKIGLYHIFWPIIRVLKWSGEVDRARQFYTKWSPEGIEKHFVTGGMHKPMCCLLTICDGSSAEYDIAGSDIEMALDFDVPDMTDLNMIVDGWSVKTLAAELCLHLARRLEPGDTSREALIDRGIKMSTLATERTVAANGMIKHILAYEAHKGIDDRLLELRKEDNAVSRSIIYNSPDLADSRSSLDDLTSENVVRSSHSNHSRRSSQVSNFASRFVVKDKTSSARSNTTRSASKGSSGSREGDSGDKGKRKVAFSSRCSSLASNASAASKHESLHSVAEDSPTSVVEQAPPDGERV